MKANHLFNKVFLFLFILGWAGCGGSSQKIEVSQHRLGEKVMAEKLSLTVNSVSRNVPAPPESSIPEGKEWIAVHITVVNEGKQALSFKLEELTLKDAQGKIYHGDPMGGPGNLLSTGRYLAMGDRVNGALLYEISQGAKGLVLQYEAKKLKKKFLIKLD